MTKKINNLKFFGTIFLMLILAIFLFRVNNTEEDKISSSNNSNGDLYSNYSLTAGDNGYTQALPTENTIVTYSLINCSEPAKVKAEYAFDYIEDISDNQIKFRANSNNPDLNYICLLNLGYDNYYETISGETWEVTEQIYGEALVESYGKGNVKGTIYRYTSDDCRQLIKPVTEIHEILHVLGLEHAKEYNPNNIMNSYPINCDASIFIDDLIFLANTYGFEAPRGYNFQWYSLPVTYSISSNCEGKIIRNIRDGEEYLEEKAKIDLLQDAGYDSQAKINFSCREYKSDGKEVYLDYVTKDLPIALPEYIFEGDNIKEVKISIFNVGFEMHELLHGLGIVEHEGLLMKERCFDIGERPYCIYRDGNPAIETLKKIYSS